MDVVQRIAKRENDINILKIETEVFITRSHIKMFVTVRF